MEFTMCLHTQHSINVTKTNGDYGSNSSSSNSSRNWGKEGHPLGKEAFKKNRVGTFFITFVFEVCIVE